MTEIKQPKLTKQGRGLTPKIFNKLQVRCNSWECYHCTTTCKNGGPRCAQICSQQGNSYCRISRRQEGARAHSRISRRSHSPKGCGQSNLGSFCGRRLNPQGESPVTGLLLLRPASGCFWWHPFYSLVGSHVWSFMVSGLETSLSRGPSLARTLSVN